MLISLSKEKVNNWDNIHSILNNLETHTIPERSINKQKNSKKTKRGVAFITFDFGIDGVSIEIQKYALILEKLFASRSKNTVLHFISGDFHDKADAVLLPRWKRFKIKGINGWSKWDDGKWFSDLFYSDMPENSDISDFLAQEIWKQTLEFSGILCSYIIENNIDLLIPVNICSNPGNLAINLAVIIVTELLKMKVISSNHDFYWEGGKADRKQGEEAGVRDHFFRNYKNHVIIVGANLDHLGFCYEVMPGANDNASGIAVLLAVAEALSQSPVKPKRTILFIALGSNKQGFLGVKTYMKQPFFPLDRAKAFIGLERVGCGQKYHVTGSEDYPGLYKHLRKSNKKYSSYEMAGFRFPVLGLPASDAVFFHKKRIPALLISTEEEPVSFSGRQDTYDKVDPKIMSELVKVLYFSLLDIAGQSELNLF